MERLKRLKIVDWRDWRLEIGDWRLEIRVQHVVLIVLVVLVVLVVVLVVHWRLETGDCRLERLEVGEWRDWRLE